MQIAVFIQNRETRLLLSQFLDLYQEQRKADFRSFFYESDIELLSDLSSGAYDVIFFSTPQDALLMNEIREKDMQVRLIRIAAANSVMEVNSKDIWYCLSEPLEMPFLFPVLDRLMDDIQRNSEAGLMIKKRGIITYLAFSQIEYVGVMGKKIYFYLIDGKTEKISGSFYKLQARLLHCPDFIKVHRAYIVNLRHVSKLESSTIITHNGHSVPVSRHLYSQLKKDYLCRYMDPSIEAEGTILDLQSNDCSTEETYSILLVDDEEDQRRYWSHLLIDNGCLVQTADSSETALPLAEQGHLRLRGVRCKSGTG